LFARGKAHAIAHPLLPGYIAKLKEEPQCDDTSISSSNGKMQKKQSRSDVKKKQKSTKLAEKKSNKIIEHYFIFQSK